MGKTMYQLYATRYDYTDIGPLFPTRDLAEQAKELSEEQPHEGNIRIREVEVKEEPEAFSPYF